MPPARPEFLALLSAHATACHSMPYPVSFPAALCAWHVLPNACVRTPTIPQVTHAVDKIVGSACRRGYRWEQNTGLRVIRDWVNRADGQPMAGTPALQFNADTQAPRAAPVSRSP